MSEFNATHTGEIRRTEHNLPMGQRSKIGLRSTAAAWVGEDGRRYDKESGFPVGEEPPMFQLRLTSVKRLPSARKLAAAAAKKN
jgi:hypothetical protein